MRLGEEQYRAMVNSVADDIIILDVHGRIAHHNHPAHACEPDQAIGSDWLALIEPVDRQAATQALTDVRATGNPTATELHAIGRNGRSIHVQVKLSCLPPREAGQVLVIARDITDRKRAEEALTLGRRQLELALQSAGAGTWDWDMASQRLEWSDALFTLLGLDPHTTQVTIDMWTGALHPEDRDLANARIERSIKERTPLAIEYRVVLPDEQVRWIHALGNTSYDAAGLPLRMTGICTDITDRKRMEASLRESESALREAQRVACIGSWRWDAVNDAVVWSDELYRIYDKTPGTRPHTYEVDRKNYTQASAETLASAVTRALETGESYALDLERNCGSRPRRWVLARGEVVRDSGGKVVGLRGTVQDITERKSAEEALKDNEEKLRKLFDTMSEGVALNEVVVDDQGEPADYRIIEVNRSYYTNADYEPGPVIGNVATKLYGMSTELIRAFFKAHVGRSERVTTEFLSPRSKRWYAISTSPIKDGRFVTTFVDITDRKRTEEENHHLQERLQRAEKMEALGTLAGGVAHDLNNVLGVIVGFSELLLESADVGSPMRNGLENVMKGGHRAAAIVDDLLALARRGVQSRSVLQLNKVVDDCQKSPELAKLCERHPLATITTEFEPVLLNISGSPVHIGKTLYNLISNACEAIHGSGRVTIRTSNQYLDRPLQGYDRIREGDYAVLSVSDTGEGIPANDLKRIFEPFYTKKMMGRSGTGLGLAVVWGTVKDHDGYINVYSGEGQGSTFSLYFPATRQAMPAEDPVVLKSQYLGRGESILVVDDVPEQRHLAEAMLTSLNYKVRTLGSGEEAVAYLQEHDVDLLVLDMIMDPGMDGLETFKKVRAIRPRLKAILVSGYSESDRVKATKDLGAGCYVRKPYIKEKLGLAVRSELDRVA
jgi:PAS domain S-box-containing protein